MTGRRSFSAYAVLWREISKATVSFEKGSRGSRGHRRNSGGQEQRRRLKLAMYNLVLLAAWQHHRGFVRDAPHVSPSLVGVHQLKTL